MNSSSADKGSIRLAVLTLSISHFEVPLFRLCAQRDDLDIKVFHLLPVKSRSFDTEYIGEIDWGVDMLDGYESQQVDDWSALARNAREWGADVVLIYGYGWPGGPQLILRNWWNGIPQVHRGTLNYYLDPRRPIKGRIMRPIGRFLLSLFDAHQYGGDYSHKVLLDVGAVAESLFFVPYSIDTKYFIDQSDREDVKELARKLRASLGWKKDSQVILFIAQHNWFKGPDIAMEVFRNVAERNTQARFLVVGAGRMTEEMRAYAKKYLPEGVCHFAGFVPSAHTTSYYLASDLVLCTSRYETWARMVNEAMLCRRPCLVSRIVPAAGGLIEKKVNGYVVDKFNVKSFVDAVEDHFRLPEEKRAAMGELARKKAEGFAYEPYVDNVVEAARYAMNHTRKVKKRVTKK